uniref:Photosystem II reaction center Psb28 protein n=1 Tax=Rhizochromulina marina TaxID=1034831 RepID=A0A514CQ24_9STRA|nr:photosystem II reaction center W protein [Rhizochromulina marina]QDH81900.1 photosystem II reaction center W protein [Rhizochromulina marina]
MQIRIEFIPGIIEKVVPEIRLTKANKGETGTAIFRFKNPTLFSLRWEEKFEIKGMSIIDKNRIINTKRLNLYFVKGKPHTLEAIFILRNKTEWTDLQYILNQFSKQNNLTFIRANSNI